VKKLFILAAAFLALAFVTQAQMVACATGSTTASFGTSTDNVRACPGALPGKLYVVRVEHAVTTLCGGGFAKVQDAGAVDVIVHTSLLAAHSDNVWRILIFGGVHEVSDATGCGSTAVTQTSTAIVGLGTPLHVKTGGF
jgi:hypothetical protein